MTEVNKLYAAMVGMHFRPPAKQLVVLLSSGTDLVLVPEPENPYDRKAIKVMLPLDVFEDFAKSKGVEVVNAFFEGTGYTVEDLLEAGDIHLGYVEDSAGKGFAKRLANEFPLVGGETVRPVGNAEIGEVMKLLTEEGLVYIVSLVFDQYSNPFVKFEAKG